MQNEIIKGLSKKINYKQIVKELSEHIDRSQLQSVLLDVFRKKAIQMQPDILFGNYKKNRFVQNSELDPLLLAKFDVLAFELLPEQFARIELSPVSPFGTCSTIATVNQDKVISASRNVEVTSDATNVLALEATKRRKEILIKASRKSERIHLAASHRVVRSQLFENEYFTPHFKLFNLCSAGRDEGNKKFEIEAAILHLEFYISLFYKALDMDKIKNIAIRLLNFNKGNELLKAGILKHFAQQEHEKIHFMVDQKDHRGLNYYDELRIMIHATNSKNQSFHLVDGGYTNWTSTIISDKKERLLTSCIGSELLLKTMDIKDFI